MSDYLVVDSRDGNRVFILGIDGAKNEREAAQQYLEHISIRNPDDKQYWLNAVPIGTGPVVLTVNKLLGTQPTETGIPVDWAKVFGVELTDIKPWRNK